MKFTEISIKRLKLPESGRKIFFDDSLPGFGLRVAKKSKTFVVLYGQGEGRRYKTLGRYPDLSLADARKEAKTQMVNGSSVRGSAKFPDVVDEFLDDCENHNRPSTIRSYRHYLKAFNTRKRVQDIRRIDVQNHLARYSDKPSGYSHALTAFKIFFNWCLRKEKIDRHPVAGERAVVMPSRERTLLPDEIKAIWAYEFPNFSTILKLCLITGQRRSEIAAIEFDWINGDVLTIPADVAKNKRRHSIPITEKTLELLQSVPFGENGPWNGWSNGKKRIDRFVDIPHWTIHDLRRTYSTIMAEIGTPIHITERLLNHASGTTTSGVIGIYNRYSYMDEMRTAQLSYEKCLYSILAS